MSAAYHERECDFLIGGSCSCGGVEESIQAITEAVRIPRQKANYVGAPAIFALETACAQVCEAFGSYGCYLVGSALDRPDWRDVDIRYIMADEEFAKLFPDAHVFPDGKGGCWEQDPRWLLLTVAISERLSKLTGLPVDFQFQPQSHANERHKGKRSAIGFKIAKPRKQETNL